MKNHPYRHPLKQAIGYGAAHSGANHWWFQRLTAGVLAVLVFWLVFLILSLLHQDYEGARSTIARPWNATLMIAFIVTTAWHATLGMQVIIEDYVHVRWQEIILQVMLRCATGFGALMSIMAVLHICITR